MVFHWSLSDSKFPQVSRTFLSILAVLNVVVCMVSTRPPTSESSSPFNNPLVTVSKAPITIGIIVTFMFHRFFFSLARSRYYPSFHILSVLFCGQPEQQSRQFCKFSFLLFIIIRSSLLAEIKRSVCMSKSHRIAHLPVDHLADLVLYSFCANLLHSLIMWLMISSLSPHSLHLLFVASSYLLLSLS